MTESSKHPYESDSSQAWFTTTHWTVVLTAQQEADEQAREALSKLCETYWRPLYAFVRRRGYSRHDAEDLIQSFLLQLIDRMFRSFSIAVFPIDWLELTWCPAERVLLFSPPIDIFDRRDQGLCAGSLSRQIMVRLIASPS